MMLSLFPYTFYMQCNKTILFQIFFEDMALQILDHFLTGLFVFLRCEIPLHTLDVSDLSDMQFVNTPLCNLS